MAHAQKPDFVFRLNGRVHLNWRGASVQSTTGSRVVRISGSNAGYTTFRGSVKGTGYPTPFASLPLHFPSCASPCAITFQLESTTTQRDGSYIEKKVYMSSLRSLLLCTLSYRTNQMETFIRVIVTGNE